MDTEAYDSSSTVFSPDGRIYQIEYSREAVKKGSPVVSMIYDNGVVMISVRKKPNKIAEDINGLKINRISENIIMGTSGLMADCRTITDYARRIALNYKKTYDETASTSLVTNQIGNLMQYYTQFSGNRPMGAALLIAGVDIDGSREPTLYEVDSSGAEIPYWATAIGINRENIADRLKAYYSKELKQTEAIDLALQALNEAVPVLTEWDKYEVTGAVVDLDSGYSDIDFTDKFKKQ